MLNIWNELRKTIENSKKKTFGKVSTKIHKIKLLCISSVKYNLKKKNHYGEDKNIYFYIQVYF